MNLDESPAAELWRRTLSQIPCFFGRIVYLATLRDTNTGLYQHHGFAQRFTPREADRTLRRSHENIFNDWLTFSLEEQKNDLEMYLAQTGETRDIVLENWRKSQPFASFIPANAHAAQKQLFLADLKIVLDLIA